MQTPATFLDLNGTVVEPVVVDRLADLSIVPDAPIAVARLNRAGFICPVVTVQSRIAKGVFSRGEFDSWFSGLAAELHRSGAEVLGPYICPHRFREPCVCKKPNPFLYRLAAEELGIDLARAFVIGDSAADVEAAHRFGGRGCLVRTGWGANPKEVERAAPFASYIAGSLMDAVTWILEVAS